MRTSNLIEYRTADSFGSNRPVDYRGRKLRWVAVPGAVAAECRSKEAFLGSVRPGNAADHLSPMQFAGTNLLPVRPA